MKKINIISQIIIALGILTLFIIAVFFNFYTYNEDGSIMGDWRANESIMYLGTARLITFIAGCLIVLSIVLFFISQDKSIRKQNTAGLLIIALSAITIIGTLNSFYPCTEMMRMNDRPMRCYWTMKVLLAFAGTISVSGLLMLLFNKSKDFINGLNISVVMLGCLYLLTPSKLTEGFCSMVMPCIERYRSFALMMGGFMLAVSVFNFFLLNKKSKELK